MKNLMVLAEWLLQWVQDPLKRCILILAITITASYFVFEQKNKEVEIVLETLDFYKKKEKEYKWLIDQKNAIISDRDSEIKNNLKNKSKDCQDYIKNSLDYIKELNRKLEEEKVKITNEYSESNPPMTIINE